VAQLNRTFAHALRTPLPDSSDSDDVVLALETARALEARGDVSEATRWLRRAAEEAENQGHDARVLLFAHVAADLSSSVPPRPSAPVPAPARRAEPSDPSDLTEPSIRQPDFAATVPRAKSGAHGAPDPSLRTIPDDETSPSLSFVCQLSISPAQPVSTRMMRLGAIRVAIRKSPGEKRFSVEQLDAGQALPAGTIEGMLIVGHDVDDSRESPTEERGRRGAKT